MNPVVYHHAPATTEYGTPAELFSRLDAEFHFEIDAAASADNAKCPDYFDRKSDGLSSPWNARRVWLNPPYGRAIASWMAKAYRESLAGSLVVCLMPARTDSEWWHEYAMRGEIRFLRGRVKFIGARYSAPFPSAVIIFRARKARRAA